MKGLLNSFGIPYLSMLNRVYNANISEQHSFIFTDNHHTGADYSDPPDDDPKTKAHYYFSIPGRFSAWLDKRQIGVCSCYYFST